jgi:hypothetical protein
MLKSLFNILPVLISVVAFAQQPKADTTKAKADTVRNRYLPTGFRIGTDVIALIKTSTQDNFSGWEANADVDFNRYFLAGDFGNWSRTYLTDSANYKNSGNYWRAGVDVNFLLKDPDRNVFFIGFRYGRSTFSEDLTINSYDPVWGHFIRSYSNPNVTGRWLELTSGIRVKIWKMIWMGYTARFKFGLKTRGETQMLTHDVPGYGRTDKDSYWGFNYQIFFRIPFRETPPPLKK